MIIKLIDRVLLLSHPSFHKKNFDLVIKILLNNGYPLSLIFSTIKKRFNKKFDLFIHANDFVIDEQWTTQEDINNKKFYPTFAVITQHRMDLLHEFDWDNVHILDKEQIVHKRLLSEMIYIKKQA